MQLVHLLYAFLLPLMASAYVGFYNPLKTYNGSDPFMVYSDGYYYLLTTTWTNIQITRSTTIAGLKTATPEVVWTDSTASRCCNVWAPEVHYIAGYWWIYYSAGDSADTGGQRPYVLQGTTTDPMGPYSFASQLEPPNAPDVWAIDGTVITVNGDRYFVFSSFSPSDLQSLYIAPLTNPTTLGDRVLISEPTLSWETVDSPVNEGPQGMYNGSQVWLTYSASACWSSSYELGLLTLTEGADPTVASSWTKSSTPVFTSANGDYGPGHNGIFNSPDGTETWLVYHMSESSDVECNGDRVTMAQKIDWHSNGAPNFGEPRALTDYVPVPSGDPAA